MRKFLSKYAITIVWIIGTVLAYLFSDRNFLGDMQSTEFFRYIVWASIGTLGGLLLDANYRDPNKRGTPVEHSNKVLFLYNWQRFFTTWLFLILAIRFFPVLFANEQIGDASAIGLGIIKDVLPVIVKNWAKIRAPKQNV